MGSLEEMFRDMFLRMNVGADRRPGGAPHAAPRSCRCQLPPALARMLVLQS